VALLLASTLGCHAARSNPFTDPDAGNALRARIAADPQGDLAAIQKTWTNYSYNRWPYDCAPTRYWVRAEQGMDTMQNGVAVPRCPDVASTMIDYNVPSELIAIDRVTGTEPREYRLTIRYDLSRAARVSPYSPRTTLVTHFAVLEDGEWKLAGALGRLTRTWQRETVGPFTYIVSPTRRFSRARADSAVRLVDSLAVAFGQPSLRPTRYFVVADADEMLYISGIRSDTVYGGAGGRTFGDFILSGDPVFGEKHGHEITHLVLSPMYGSPNLTVIASEGVPSWLGGTRSMHFPKAVRALRDHLQKNPTATLDSLIASNAHPMFNPAAALLASIVHAHGGVPGIAQFLKAGPGLPEFRRGVERITAKSWNEIANEWRTTALATPD
jgi:hypothetical protein